MCYGVVISWVGTKRKQANITLIRLPCLCTTGAMYTATTATIETILEVELLMITKIKYDFKNLYLAIIVY